jgi:ABC-2 type transport system permease protein
MNPAGFPEQVRRAWAIAKKDIRIYYFKGPVLIFGIFMPVFLFLAFFMGSRQLPLSFLISGLVGNDSILHRHCRIPRYLSLGGLGKDP